MILNLKTNIKIFLFLSIFSVACKKDNILNPEQSEFFIKYFGNSAVNESGDIKKTTDGGYIIIGSAVNGTSTDISLVKTDAFGNKLWAKTFGGSSDDMGRSIQLTSDGGYILLGTYKHSLTNTDMYVIKTNAEGNELWSDTIGGYGNQEGNCVKQTSDGGFIAVGSTIPITAGNSAGTKDVFYAKIDAQGVLLWSNTKITNNLADYATSVEEKPNGGFVIIGSSETNPAKGSDVKLINTDALGEYLTGFVFGGNNNDYGENIQLLADESYIVIGSTSSFGKGGSDVYMLKLQMTGNDFTELWYKTFGGTSDDLGVKIISTNDNGYVIAGATKSIGSGDFDQYLVKTNSEGVEQWSKTFGGLGVDKARALVQANDNGYVLLGSTVLGGNPMICLIKTKSNGELK